MNCAFKDPLPVQAWVSWVDSAPGVNTIIWGGFCPAGLQQLQPSASSWMIADWPVCPQPRDDHSSPARPGDKDMGP